MRPNSETSKSDVIWMLTNRCVSIKPKLFRPNFTTGSQLVTSHPFEFDDNDHFQSRPKPSTPHRAIYPLTRPTWKHFICSRKFWARNSDSKNRVNNLGVMADRNLGFMEKSSDSNPFIDGYVYFCVFENKRLLTFTNLLITKLTYRLGIVGVPLGPKLT